MSITMARFQRIRGGWRKVPGNAMARRNPVRGLRKKPLVRLMKQVATRVQNAGLETKYVSSEVNTLAFNGNISSSLECYSLYPPLGPGTATYQRVGIDVTPIRVQNNWIISLNSVSRSVNVMVDMYLLIDKNLRYFPQIATQPSGPYFLRTGNSSGPGNTQQYNGINTDSFKMINKERYTLLKHFRFQLASNVGQANGDTTTGNAPNVSVQSQKTIEYVVDTPKQLRYNPGGTAPDYPAGHAPFWVLGYSKVDGTAPDLVNLSINVSQISQMIYKDA